MNVSFCFACRGFRADELLRQVSSEDTNIRMVDFASEDELERHLAAADMHLISLRDEWTGVVVPSKFFGSLAVGRPVIYDGPKDSSVAQWIQEFSVGAVLDVHDIESAIQYLSRLLEADGSIQELQARAYRAYVENFSRGKILDAWDKILRKQIGEVRALPDWKAGRHPAGPQTDWGQARQGVSPKILP